ncbi:ABC transporter ATP-binding protein [Iodobacter sp. CM08]|uniref:ABC transporter ATP-binding protein n=1 Tax=Iodobacter sp. CM08 TaxID=3085902 RepID=UPI0029814070|nr:ABC transporter ATP-binding protein [Iodobacter sp. CM08]MDW5416575.1 ABC transporter ATP-binding protein [Iodobacter sp. CM08]
MSSLRRLFQYAGVYRRDAYLASLFSIINKFFDILPEVLIGVAVDVVVNREASFLAKLGVSDSFHQLLYLGVITALVWGGESLFEYLFQIRWRNLAQNLQHDLRLDAYRHVQKLPLSYFENKSTGKLMAILNDDINQMERFLNGGANSIIQVLCSTVMVSAVFFYIAPQLALIALAPVPLILLGTFWFQHRIAPRYATVREAAGVISGRLNNNLLGIATIKAFTAEDFEASHISDASNHYRQSNRSAIQLSAAIIPVIRMAILSGFVVTLVYGGYLALNGKIGVGSYSVLVFLTQRLLWPLTGLADIADLYQRSMTAIERVLDLLDTPIHIHYEGQPLGQIKGALSFEHVSFSYGEQPVLKDISLHIAAGQTVAFVGATGSGKSTLLKLLLRFYEQQQGSIKIDGIASQDIALLDLRRAIGYVGQDVFLSDASIAQNIAYGQQAADIKAVVAAARAAEAHEFIERLPQGYDTQIGERGQKLSGGQRQRLALARAIYKNPKILVLDEATSAVDNETEAAIQRSLDQIAKGRTTLVVAHRLSTVRNAHCIYVMEQGEIIEAGTHELLLAQEGNYAALWRLQTGLRENDAELV